jgi:hypothetical protein
MKLGDGLFLNTFRRVAEEYRSSGIEFNDMIVDNTFVLVAFLVSFILSPVLGLCNSSPGLANLMSWSCPICMVPSSLILELRSLVDLVLFLGVTLAE